MNRGLGESGKTSNAQTLLELAVDKCREQEEANAAYHAYIYRSSASLTDS